MTTMRPPRNPPLTLTKLIEIASISNLFSKMQGLTICLLILWLHYTEHSAYSGDNLALRTAAPVCVYCIVRLIALLLCQIIVLFAS